MTKSTLEAATKDIKVLLVDDEEDFVNALSERIRMRELSSKVALDGEQALKVVKDEIPDVMVLDLRMPGIDGLEVLRRVKKAYPEVQVIILTGHGTERDEEEARKLGAFDYLQKPVELDNLIKVIKDAHLSKMDKSMLASTFAEYGEFNTAKNIMKEEKKN